MADLSLTVSLTPDANAPGGVDYTLAFDKGNSNYWDDANQCINFANAPSGSTFDIKLVTSSMNNPFGSGTVTVIWKPEPFAAINIKLWSNGAYTAPGEFTPSFPSADTLHVADLNTEHTNYRFWLYFILGSGTSSQREVNYDPEIKNQPL